MPLYRYRAVSTTGEVAVGELDAANESEIVDRLRDRGLMPMQIAHAAGVAIASSGVVASKGARRRWFESKTVTRDQPKVGPNAPCPCGSGKKYKKCCGAGA